MPLSRGDVTWRVSKPAANSLWTIRKKMGEVPYAESTRSLQDLLCDYFDATACMGDLGKSIRPVGGTNDGGKLLKVRQALPGRGKSGGLRLLIVAYCDEQRVLVVKAGERKIADKAQAKRRKGKARPSY